MATDYDTVGKLRKNGRALTTPVSTELLEELLRYLRMGNYVNVACQAVGITKETLYQWRYRGRLAEMRQANGEELSELDKVYLSVGKRMAEESAKAETDAIERIRAAGENPAHWKALAWHLERKNPERWSTREEVALVEGKTPEELAREKDPQEILLKAKTLIEKLKDKLG